METATSRLNKRSRLESAIEDGEPIARRRLAEVETELRQSGLSDFRRRQLQIEKAEYEISLETLAEMRAK